MGHTITKKVRLDDAYARRLARLARKRGVSESEILRQGLDLIEQTDQREKALARLIELAEIKGPQKERYEFR